MADLRVPSCVVTLSCTSWIISLRAVGSSCLSWCPESDSTWLDLVAYMKEDRLTSEELEK